MITGNGSEGVLRQGHLHYAGLPQGPHCFRLTDPSLVWNAAGPQAVCPTGCLSPDPTAWMLLGSSSPRLAPCSYQVLPGFPLWMW